MANYQVIINLSNDEIFDWIFFDDDDQLSHGELLDLELYEEFVYVV